jgi:hypothetical protein
VFVAPWILLQVEPLLVLSCHCTNGVVDADAAAVKEAVAPEQTVVSDGFPVTDTEGTGVEKLTVTSQRARSEIRTSSKYPDVTHASVLLK